MPGAACSALGGSGGAPRVVLLGRGSSFPLPPREARETHFIAIDARAAFVDDPTRAGDGRKEGLWTSPEKFEEDHLKSHQRPAAPGSGPRRD